VTVAANASGQPRIDIVILTMTGYGTGTVSVVTGTGTAGATLDNRTGAPALPAGAFLLADILMPNAFAGPFVQNTHIRDRRPWAKGAFAVQVVASGAGLTSGGSFHGAAFGGGTMRVELSGAPIRVYEICTFTPNTASAIITSGPTIGGVYMFAGRGMHNPIAGGAVQYVDIAHNFAPGAQSAKVDIFSTISVGTMSFGQSVLVLEEINKVPGTFNSGA
jgi:hypothetical protein